MYSNFQKIKKVCIFLCIISLLLVICIVPYVGDTLPPEWILILLSLYLCFVPTIFAILAIALGKISYELKVESFSALEQISKLEKELENMKKCIAAQYNSIS